MLLCKLRMESKRTDHATNCYLLSPFRPVLLNDQFMCAGNIICPMSKATQITTEEPPTPKIARGVSRHLAQ